MHDGLGPRFRSAAYVAMLAGVLVPLLAPGAMADLQTTLAFASPSTIAPGGSVTVDLGINFIPLPGTIGTPEFEDDVSRTDVASCAADPNPCTEIQISTAASTISQPFAEILTEPTPPMPQFYPFNTLGTHPVTITYPSAGTFEIDVVGAPDPELVSETECVTQFTGGVPGSPSCSSIGTIPITGAFDPKGDPRLFVHVVAATAVPEPSGLLVVGTAFLGLALRRRKRRE